MLGMGALACSGGGSGGPAEEADAGGASSNGGSGNGGSSGSPGGNGGSKPTGNDAGAKPSDAGSTAPLKYGMVTLSQSYVTASKTYSHSALAAFANATLSTSGATSNCTTVTEGTCKVMTCTPVVAADAGAPKDAGTVDAGPVVPPNAGTVSLSGPTMKASIDLTPDPKTGAYGINMAATQAFAAGDAIKISAAGADVPAFSATLTAPAILMVTAPAATNGLYSVSRTVDLMVKFTGGDAKTDVHVLLSGQDAMKDTIIAQCSGPSAGGSLTIGATTLGHFAAKGSGGFSVSTQTTQMDPAGGFQVNLSVNQSNLSGAFSATN